MYDQSGIMEPLLNIALPSRNIELGGMNLLVKVPDPAGMVHGLIG